MRPIKKFEKNRLKVFYFHEADNNTFGSAPILLLSVAGSRISRRGWGRRQLRRLGQKLIITARNESCGKAVFTPVCHSVPKGGVSVSACTTGHMTRGSLSRGGLRPEEGLCP